MSRRVLSDTRAPSERRLAAIAARNRARRELVKMLPSLPLYMLTKDGQRADVRS